MHFEAKANRIGDGLDVGREREGDTRPLGFLLSVLHSGGIY